MAIIFLLTSSFMYIVLSISHTANYPWLKYWPTQTLDRRKLIENKLRESLKHDKGTGCKIPVLDPFNKEVTQYAKEAKAIVCNNQDWVKCHYSECKVVGEILERTLDIVCTYRDLLYVSDNKYVYGAPVTLYNTQWYVLRRSDHVKINCSGIQIKSLSMGHRLRVLGLPFFFRDVVNTMPLKWTGISLGFRKYIDLVPPPPNNKNSIDVLIFGFESLSKYGLIREMPKTFQYIIKELKMTILEGYNIVGDGTAAALFPLLSGQTECEVPDPRTKMTHNTIDAKNFIFDRAKKHGYRTAYFEDLGTFQRIYNGFNKQPADHYSRAFLRKNLNTSYQTNCIGDTPIHRILMNITEQFLNLPNTKRFIFTFIAHDSFNMIPIADEATVEFFKSFKKNRRTKNTLLVFMGGHGSRYAPLRKTFQGYLEERLPLMAILLPDNLLEVRLEAQNILESNSNVLATPHDIHATILDAMGLPQYIPKYKIPGADLPRAMSLLRPIPIKRSCSEAGIEPQWCACVTWDPIFPGNPMHHKASQALFNYINYLTEPVRSHCALRTLKSVSWVRKQLIKKKASMKPQMEIYQVRLTVGPGIAVFEGTVAYLTKENQFSVQSRQISRMNHRKHPTGLNGYRLEPDCLQHTHAHLTKFCYCRNT